MLGLLLRAMAHSGPGHDPACGAMKGKVAAARARVSALNSRRNELQAELAQLVDRHRALTEVLPFARQLVRASLSPCHVQACNTFCSVQAWFSDCPCILGCCKQRPERIMLWSAVMLAQHVPVSNKACGRAGRARQAHHEHDACRRRCSSWLQWVPPRSV